jgi:hypothetical protein
MLKCASVFAYEEGHLRRLIVAPLPTDFMILRWLSSLSDIRRWRDGH